MNSVRHRGYSIAKVFGIASPHTILHLEVVPAGETNDGRRSIHLVFMDG